MMDGFTLLLSPFKLATQLLYSILPRKERFVSAISMSDEMTESTESTLCASSEHFDEPALEPFCDYRLKHILLMDRIAVQRLLHAKKYFVFHIGDTICNYTGSHNVTMEQVLVDLSM
jgi:hypothetical protein